MITYQNKLYENKHYHIYRNKHGQLSRYDGESRHKLFFRRFLIDGKFLSFEIIQNMNWDRRFTLDVI